MLKVIASSTCDVCFVEYEYENPPHCIPCGHVSCKSCLESMIAANANTSDPNTARCAFCRTTFEQSGVRRLHVDLGAVPTEVASSDGSETINGDMDGDEDENRALAREAEKLGMSVANAIFQKNEDKIRKTATEGQKWVAMQKRVRPAAAFPVLTALAQLAIGNMENFHACQLLEKKLLDSRANEARMIQKIQAFEEVTSREQQKIRTLEQELQDLRQSLSSTERSLRTTTSSLADATASLAESDTALAAANAELVSRLTERDKLRDELQKAKEDAKRMKKELSGVKLELKNLRAGGVEAEGSGAGTGNGPAKQEEAVPEKLQRRRSRKMSHSAPKSAAPAAATTAAAAVAATVAAAVDDSEAFATGSGTGSASKKGHASKKSRKKLDPDQTEDEGKDHGDHDHDKSGEHPRSKKERGRERHREKKDKDEDQPPESGLATEPRPHTGQPDGPELKEKVHKSGKKKKKHASQERPATSPERAATAPPGTEIKTQEALDSLADAPKSPDPPAPGTATSKNASSPPPTTIPRRGLVETLSRPGPLSKDGPAMRVLRKAMGRKAASPNASHDLGSSSTVINMTPAPPVASPSPVGSTSSAPAAATSPVIEPELDPSQVPRTVAYSPYPLPPVENIAGFGVTTFGQHYPSQRFPESNRPRGPSTPENDIRSHNPLPRPPRASEEEPESNYERERERDFMWGYDSSWDRSIRGTGKGRERDRDRTYRRRHLPNEWQDDPPVQIRRYVAADEVPGLSAPSRHGMFDFGDSPPAYPMYEHGIPEGGMPRKSSYANLRSMK